LGDGFTVECTTCDGNGNVTVTVISNSELPKQVVSPAGDGAIREQCAGMPTTNGDLGGCFSRECTARDCNRNVAFGRVTGSELPKSIATPTCDGGVGQQRTCVHASAGCDLGDRFAGECTSGDLNWNTGVNVVAYAELPIRVVTPTLDVAGGK
jgi:hypothetical protein